MPNKVSLCLIKIEVNSEISEEFGAVSSEHPTNPRLIKERERDRGLRNHTQITIETYTNQFPGTQTDLSTEEIADLLTAAIAVPVMNTKNSDHQFEKTTSSSRETTPRDVPPEFPKEIIYFSGNPSVELTNGIIHLYKKNERKEIKEGPSNILCLLAVPASLSCHDLLRFVGPCHSQIQHIRIVRDGSPNQFMVLLEFRSNESALEFYQTFNGAAYNSLEPDSLCHAVWVSSFERGEDGLAPLGHTELPTCPVCLERMDESVDGVLTILCNHAFHANCLIKWGDSTCPVCRHVQTPELMENSVCMECEGTDSLWICLICGHVGCGRYQGGHAAAHYRATNHAFALQLGTSSVWDYAGDNFVHRLFQNKTDGKLVAANGSPSDEGEEKIDSMQLEFTYLLTSQLDAQRKYYEERITQMEKDWLQFQANSNKVDKALESLEQRVGTLKKEKENLQRKLTVKTSKLSEVQKLLNEEQQITKALQNNQSSWQEKYDKLQSELCAMEAKYEEKVVVLEQQLRDVMFYVQAQNQIASSSMKDEIEGGTIVIPEVEASTSSGKASKLKKKNLRAKKN